MYSARSGESYVTSAKISPLTGKVPCAGIRCSGVSICHMEKHAAPQDLEALLTEDSCLRAATPYRPSGSEHDSDIPESRFGTISDRGRPRKSTMADRRWSSEARCKSLACPFHEIAMGKLSTATLYHSLLSQLLSWLRERSSSRPWEEETSPNSTH